MLATKEQIHKELCKKSFHEFVKFCWSLSKAGIEFVDELYIKFLCDHLQKRVEDIAAGIPRKGLLISIAPATGKSFIISTCLPIYLWILKPEASVMCASVNTSLALGFATDSRAIIQHPEFQKYFPFTLADDVNSKNEYMNASGGRRISFGLDTPSIGKHATLHVVDDPQSLNHVSSEVDRIRINNFLSQHLPSRTGNFPAHQRILVMQRLSQRDAFSHLESFQQDEVIVLPAEENDQVQEEHKYLYNEEGLLAPRLLPKERLDKLRSSLGAASYQSQINQNPFADENALIKPEHFQIIDHAPNNTGSRLHIFLDTAVIATKTSDYNAAVACYVIGNYIVITALFHRKLGFTTLCGEFTEWVKGLDSCGNPKIIYVEPKGSGQQVVDFLKVNSRLNVHTLKAPKDSKEQRLQGVSARIEAGRCRLVKAHWNNQLIEECCGMSRHDDIMDAVVYALETLLNERQNTGFSTRLMFAGGRDENQQHQRMLDIYYGK